MLLDAFVGCIRRCVRHRAVTTSFTLLALAACAGDGPTGIRVDDRNQTVAARVGQDLDITLGNVGPAMYVDPPHISSAALTYLGVSVIPPYTPAGPTQQFRFRAAEAGVAVVTFRRVLRDELVAVVEDTIRVR